MTGFVPRLKPATTEDAAALAALHTAVAEYLTTVHGRGPWSSKTSEKGVLYAIRFDAYDAKAGAGDFYARCGCAEVGRVTYRNTPLIYFEILLG